LTAPVLYTNSKGSDTRQTELKNIHCTTYYVIKTGTDMHKLIQKPQKTGTDANSLKFAVRATEQISRWQDSM